MRPARIAIAVIVALLGAVWFGQGIGLLPGEVMSGSLFWAVAGAALVAVGVALGAAEWRRAHRA
jgi:hypothetical protein